MIGRERKEEKQITEQLPDLKGNGAKKESEDAADTQLQHCIYTPRRWTDHHHILGRCGTPREFTEEDITGLLGRRGVARGDTRGLWLAVANE